MKRHKEVIDTAAMVTLNQVLLENECFERHWRNTWENQLQRHYAVGEFEIIVHSPRLGSSEKEVS